MREARWDRKLGVVVMARISVWLTSRKGAGKEVLEIIMNRERVIDCLA